MLFTKSRSPVFSSRHLFSPRRHRLQLSNQEIAEGHCGVFNFLILNVFQEIVSVICYEIQRDKLVHAIIIYRFALNRYLHCLVVLRDDGCSGVGCVEYIVEMAYLPEDDATIAAHT